jgi:hypothetical protein
MHRSRITVTAGLVAALSFAGIVGCHEEGPAEQAGRAIDEAAESAQEGVQDLTKEDGPLEDAGEAADEAIKDAMRAVEDATACSAREWPAGRLP